MCVFAPIVGFSMIRNCNNGRIAWLAIFLAHRPHDFGSSLQIKSLDKLVSHYTKLRVLYSYLWSVFEPKGIV